MELKTFLNAIAIIPLISAVSGQNNKIYFPNDTHYGENSPCKTSDGYDGYCVVFEDCPTIAYSKPSSNDICAFKLRTALYCCPQREEIGAEDKNWAIDIENRITPKIKNQSEIIKDLRPADANCEIWYPRLSYDKFFVGGVRSLANKHPHMAAIGWGNTDGEVDWKCGGSVIAENFILTAAHCTNSGGISPNTARTGDLNLSVNEPNLFPVDYNITNIYVHPDYNNVTSYHDIALLKISPGLEIEIPWKRPACLWTKLQLPVDELLGMGYGTTQFAGPRSNELYEGNLSVVTTDECSMKIPSDANFPNGIISGQFCAQDPEHKKDTCQGDSGGPLQFSFGESINMRTLLVGITSFGQACASSVPGVYTRISTYIDWIESIVWPSITG